MSKLIFLDIDGTLLHHGMGIPSSAKKAIQLAKQKGHKLFVATGRPKSEISSDIKNLGFDGFVCSAGAAVEVENRIIHKQEMDSVFVEKLVEFLQQYEFGFILEGHCHSYCNPKAADFFGQLIEDQSMAMDKEKFLPLSRFSPTASKIDKVALFSENPDHFEALKAHLRLHPEVNLLVYESFQEGTINADLLMKGVTKASGIAHLLSHYSKSIDDTISFGDSINDMEMIAATKLGICMGNGVDALKKIADDITDTVENDGIYKAFSKYQLI